MPTLHWESKKTPAPIQASVEVDSLVYPGGNGYPDGDLQGQLYFGDNLAVMSALLPQYEGKVDLIYADPPFFTNRRYPARIGRGEDSRRPKYWRLAEGYPDHWESIEDYLNMLYPRLALMHRLLAPAGTLYLHLDWHANHYARLLLDEIFGPERLLNEIVWVYHGPSPIRTAFNRKHDTLLIYTKGSRYTFNVDAVRQPYDPSTVKTFASSPKAGFGKVPDLARGKVPEDWWYFPVVARLHGERTGYPTQKPEALLERLVRASSNPGDLVADFFCGSGTAALVAARLGRRFLAADAAWRAIYTTRSRLVERQGCPFSLHKEAKAQIPEGGLQIKARHQMDERSLSVTLEGSNLSQVEFWEVDPAWDGRIFHSLAQAVRPRSSAAVPSSLILLARGNLPACVRLVGVDGKQDHIVFE